LNYICGWHDGSDAESSLLSSLDSSLISYGCSPDPGSIMTRCLWVIPQGREWNALGWKVCTALLVIKIKANLHLNNPLAMGDINKKKW